MNLPKVFRSGGITKAHLDQVKEDAERITLKRIREAQEEAEYQKKKEEKVKKVSKKQITVSEHLPDRYTGIKGEETTNLHKE